MIEKHYPASREKWLELRKKFVTSTDMAALFGLSEWKSPYELWHEKHKGYEPEFKETERVEWGKALELLVADAVGVRFGKEVMPDNCFRSCDGIGASYDFEILDGKDTIPLEIKTVDSLIFRDKFITEGGEIIELPITYEMQVQTQLMLHESDRIIIGVLVGGNKLYIVEREGDPLIQDKIREKVAEFWAMGTPPDMRPEMDLEILKKLNSDIGAGEVVEADEDLEELMAGYHAMAKMKSDATTGLDAIKARILERIGTAKELHGENYKITRSIVAEKEISFTREAYTTFKLTKKRK